MQTTFFRRVGRLLFAASSLALAAALCSACGAGASSSASAAQSLSQSPPQSAPPESEASAAVQVPFTFTSVAAGGYDKNDELPLARVVASPKELAAFYEEYRAQFELDGPQGGGEFAAQMEQYDDAYFGDHLLMVALMEATNGAESLTPETITAEGGAYMLSVASETAGIGTTALEYSAWFLEIAPDNGVMPVEMEMQEST